LKKISCSNHVFYRLKVIKREKKQLKFFRLSRAVAAAAAAAPPLTEIYATPTA
jgi:hypothetical protein